MLNLNTTIIMSLLVLSCLMGNVYAEDKVINPQIEEVNVVGFRTNFDTQELDFNTEDLSSIEMSTLEIPKFERPSVYDLKIMTEISVASE